MALITCNECTSTVSSSASACPNCGYPVARNELLNRASKKIKELFSKEGPEIGASYLIDPDNAEYLFSAMTPTEKAPASLRRINGIGCCMGRVTPVAYSRGKTIGVSRLYITILFIPIIPLGHHVVEDWGGAYGFLGKVKGSVCNEVFGNGFVLRNYLRDFSKGLLIIMALLFTIALLAKR